MWGRGGVGIVRGGVEVSRGGLVKGKIQKEKHFSCQGRKRQRKWDEREEKKKRFVGRRRLALQDGEDGRTRNERDVARERCRTRGEKTGISKGREMLKKGEESCMREEEGCCKEGGRILHVLRVRHATNTFRNVLNVFGCGI